MNEQIKEALEEAKRRIIEVCFCHAHPAPIATLQRIDEALSALSASQPPMKSMEDLIAWLDSLHETDGSAITNRKWAVAQQAIAAIKAASQPVSAELTELKQTAWRNFNVMQLVMNYLLEHYEDKFDVTHTEQEGDEGEAAAQNIIDCIKRIATSGQAGQSEAKCKRPHFYSKQNDAAIRNAALEEAAKIADMQPVANSIAERIRALATQAPVEPQAGQASDKCPECGFVDWRDLWTGEKKTLEVCASCGYRRPFASQPAPVEPDVCGCCHGTGWMVRDADIGTDQECFACDGTGKAEQEQPAPVNVPEGLIDLLKSIRPQYGDVGSRDVDVAEKQRRIDAAIAMLAAALVQAGGEDASTKPRKLVTLNGKQLKDLLDYAWPDKDDEDQADSEITLIEWPTPFKSTEGDDMPAGLYFYCTEYPEEGIILVDEYDAAIAARKESGNE